MNRNDAEVLKFWLEAGKVSLRRSEQMAGSDIVGDENINDMESLKFDGDAIRTVTAY